jgi:hypothetical protein
VRKQTGKAWILIFFVVWMMNCASEEIGSGNYSPQNNSVKEKPTDEVDLAPRPTRSKK